MMHGSQQQLFLLHQSSLLKQLLLLQPLLSLHLCILCRRRHIDCRMLSLLDAI